MNFHSDSSSALAIVVTTPPIQITEEQDLIITKKMESLPNKTKIRLVPDQS